MEHGVYYQQEVTYGKTVTEIESIIMARLVSIQPTLITN